MCSTDECLIERTLLLSERDAALVKSTDLDIRLSTSQKQLSDTTNSLTASRDANARSQAELVALKKLLNDKISDHERQADSNKIVAVELSDLRRQVSLLDSELATTRRDAASKSGQLQQELESSKRDAVESKRKAEEFSRRAGSLEKKVVDIGAEKERLIEAQHAHDLEIEVIRTKTAESALKERNESEREMRKLSDQFRSLEDAASLAQREKESMARDVEALQILLEQEEIKVGEKEKARKELESAKEQQYAILADYDKVNANLRATLSNTQDRLALAEGRSTVTVVSLFLLASSGARADPSLRCRSNIFEYSKKLRGRR